MFVKRYFKIWNLVYFIRYLNFSRINEKINIDLRFLKDKFY